MRDSKQSTDRVSHSTPECSCVKAAEPGCDVCGGYLDLHQPDCELPNRLLATCGDCKTWYLLDDDEEWVEIPQSMTRSKRGKASCPSLTKSS